MGGMINKANYRIDCIEWMMVFARIEMLINARLRLYQWCLVKSEMRFQLL